MDHGEESYLTLLEVLITRHGVKSANRTDTDTIRTSGELLKFDLTDETGARIMPILTTKRVYWKTVLGELLWFIEGGTDARVLAERGVHIWDDNATREFLDARGLTNHAVGDLGPVYGFQWRHYGAIYRGPHADYTGQGIDQLQNVIDGLRKDPYSRRHIICAWNPLQLDEMALPPCHYTVQFLAMPPGALDCVVNMRSADMFLGVPFNIASYAFLTHMIAYLVGMTPRTLTIMIGDAHVYVNHVEQCKTMIARKPYAFPKLEFMREAEQIECIDDFVPEDFVVVNYAHHPGLSGKMAI
jgi:thymidylate synthase